METALTILYSANHQTNNVGALTCWRMQDFMPRNSIGEVCPLLTNLSSAAVDLTPTAYKGKDVLEYDNEST